MFFEMGVLKNFAVFTGKPLCWSLFLIKQQAFRCLPVNIAKSLRAALFTEHLRWLLLQMFCFNPIQDGYFRGCSRMGGPFSPLPKICHTYPTMMKLGTVIPYLKKVQKIYKSREHPLISADISIFSPEISKFYYIKKYRYRLGFDA